MEGFVKICAVAKDHVPCKPRFVKYLLLIIRMSQSLFTNNQCVLKGLIMKFISLNAYVCQFSSAIALIQTIVHKPKLVMLINTFKKFSNFSCYAPYIHSHYTCIMLQNECNH